MKLILKNQSVNIRTLFQLSDNTYIVRIETWNHDLECFNPFNDVNFDMFSEALNCVYFK